MNKILLLSLLCCLPVFLFSQKVAHYRIVDTSHVERADGYISISYFQNVDGSLSILSASHPSQRGSTQKYKIRPGVNGNEYIYRFLIKDFNTFLKSDTLMMVSLKPETGFMGKKLDYKVFKLINIDHVPYAPKDGSVSNYVVLTGDTATTFVKQYFLKP